MGRKESDRVTQIHDVMQTDESRISNRLHLLMYFACMRIRLNNVMLNSVTAMLAVLVLVCVCVCLCMRCGEHTNSSRYNGKSFRISYAYFYCSLSLFAVNCCVAYIPPVSLVARRRRLFCPLTRIDLLACRTTCRLAKDFRAHRAKTRK